MAEAGTLCTNADVLKMAGASASTTSTAEAYTNVYIKEAEGLLCFNARYDFVSNYADLSAIGKEALREAVASYAAVKCINYDLNTFYSKQQSFMMINVLWDCWLEVYKKLNDDNYKDFIINGVV